MAAAKQAILYGFAWSSCSWRVRAALHLKGIPYTEKHVDIMKNRTNLSDAFRKVNPAQKIPALVIDDMTLVESMAILQYLEETRPSPRLTPHSLLQRIQMREICETIVSGIQPLQNVGLKPHFASEAAFSQFALHWTARGLRTLEALLRGSAGRCCVGDDVTMADLCLVPQVYNAVIRYNHNISKYETVNKVYEYLLKQTFIEETHPLKVKEKATPETQA